MISLSDRIDFALLKHGIIRETDETDEDEEKGLFVDAKNIDRSALYEAIKNSGHTITSLANECNVDPSTISRLLRKPTKDQINPDESPRDPSVGLIAKISNILHSSPEALFPDIFDSERKKTRAE